MATAHPSRSDDPDTQHSIRHRSPLLKKPASHHRPENPSLPAGRPMPRRSEAKPRGNRVPQHESRRGDACVAPAPVASFSAAQAPGEAAPGRAREVVHGSGRGHLVRWTRVGRGVHRGPEARAPREAFPGMPRRKTRLDGKNEDAPRTPAAFVRPCTPERQGGGSQPSPRRRSRRAATWATASSRGTISVSPAPPAPVLDRSLRRAAASPSTRRWGMPMRSISENMDPGPNRPVVQQHLDAGGPQLLVEGLGAVAHPPRTVCVHREERHLEGGDGIRPDDAVLIVALLDGGRRDAADADPVAAHFEGAGPAALVEADRVHRFAVLAAELEHVADLDSATDGDGAPAVPGSGRLRWRCADPRSPAPARRAPSWTPARWASSRFAPQTKSRAAAAQRSTTTGTPSPTGPTAPGPAPAASRTASRRRQSDRSPAPRRGGSP